MKCLILDFRYLCRKLVLKQRCLIKEGVIIQMLTVIVNYIDLGSAPPKVGAMPSVNIYHAISQHLLIIYIILLSHNHSKNEIIDAMCPPGHHHKATRAHGHTYCTVTHCRTAL